MPELESFGGHCAFLRVSNEPCTDSLTDRQRELALRWQFVRLDVYGECRDSHEPQSGLGPVGMAHYVD